MEEISGYIKNENEIKIKVQEKNFPEKKGDCIFKKTGKISKEKKKKEDSIYAYLENRSRENIHIFIEGKDSFGPHNRITPGEKKKINFEAPIMDGFVKFIAGRNGQKIAECKWEYKKDSTDRYPVIVFDESNPFNKLSCKTDLK